MEKKTPLKSRDLKNFNIKVKYIRVTELLSHLGITILITIGELILKRYIAMFQRPRCLSKILKVEEMWKNGLSLKLLRNVEVAVLFHVLSADFWCQKRTI